MSAHGKTLEMIEFSREWGMRLAERAGEWVQKPRDRSLRGKARIKARKAARRAAR